MNQQQQLSKVLSEFARMLAADLSIQVILDHLVERAVDVLPVSSAGVALVAHDSGTRYSAATDERSLRCERLQLEVGEGPSFEASGSGDVVAALDLRDDSRFRMFSAAALDAGFTGVLSFPLCQGETQIGVLTLYSTDDEPFDGAAMAAAQTLADVSTAYLLIAQARIELERSSDRARQSSLYDGQAVRALRSSEERKTAILASAIDAVITIDARGRIIEFNPAAELTFGCSEAAAVGLDLATLVVAPDGLGGQWTGLDHHPTANGDPLLGRRFEVQGKRGDRSTFPAEVTITPVDGDGPRFFIAFIRDLSTRVAQDIERWRLESRLQQTERHESLGQLAGVVAHDFNNLLTVMLNYASFIADSATDPQIREQAVAIVSAAERAARLTQQLLLFARREPVRSTFVDLSALVLGLRDLLERAVGENVDLVVDAAVDLPPFVGDRGQTEQLLMNLVVNARDAMTDGGTLTIQTSGGRDRGTEFVQLSVSDDGEGMTSDVALHAFDPFFSTKPTGEGSGLGLSSAYGIVSGAGGTIGIESEAGVGTTLRVRLPAATGNEPAVADAVQVDAPSVGGRETILVVEDQGPVRAVIVTMLERNGYRVFEAGGSVEALVVANTGAFDLLLTDVVMPGLSGRELAEQLRAAGHTQPVVYMSGYSSNVFTSQPELDQREALIHKPFTEAVLLDAMRTALADDATTTRGQH